MDYSAISVDEITGQVSFGMTTKKLSNFGKLVQVVVTGLYTSEGSDILFAEEGGGLPDLIGLNYDPNDVTEISTEITRRVSKLEGEIIENQIGLDISAEERLKQLEVVSLAPGADLGELNIRIRIHNEVGRTRDVVL